MPELSNAPELGQVKKKHHSGGWIFLLLSSDI
jgi:hypothetical protein